MCLLKKAIYGLKQSPRAWFDKFSEVVMHFGFKRCVVDHSVFIRKNTNGCVLLVVYVDDIILTGSDAVGIRETKSYLQQHFTTKDMERPKHFLGIESTYVKGKIVLSQRKYALDLLQETSLTGCKPKSIPLIRHQPHTSLLG